MVAACLSLASLAQSGRRVIARQYQNKPQSLPSAHSILWTCHNDHGMSAGRFIGLESQGLSLDELAYQSDLVLSE
jgi:hypothetical protein